FARGMNEGLGGIYPIVGIAAGNITAKVISKGEIVTGANIGILFTGDFRLGQAMNGGTHTPETADKTLADAVSQGGGQEPFFAFVFNCRRRRQGMIERNQLGEELIAIRKNLPGLEFFGSYGPGEIGSEKPGDTAIGVGFTVVTAVLFEN
ncbi:MAG: FIST C-terminal domain-containing protein, partial [Planctomycetes bacterium]|nr:FIST C-terminal domain-containing protein [Planctomycetota bacterium]